MMEEYPDRLEGMDHTNDILLIQEAYYRLLEFFFLLAQTKLKIRDLRTARTGPNRLVLDLSILSPWILDSK